MDAAARRTFVSNSSASIRMFERSWMEALSKVHFIVPVVVFTPIIAWFLWRTLQQQPLIEATACFGGGLLLWTLAEYLLHRYIFHFVPQSRWGLRLHFIFHGVHHDYPNDAKRLVMPPSASLPIAILFYGIFRLALPATAVDACFAGFLVGYLIYDEMHYALHHATFSHPWLKALKRHHMQHHFVDATRGFGVSTPLWDLIVRS